MTSAAEGEDLQYGLQTLQSAGENFFRRAAEPFEQNVWDSGSDFFWDKLPVGLQEEARNTTIQAVELLGRIAAAAKAAALASEADQQDLKKAVKAIRSALQLRQYRTWDAEVAHDEGTVLGFTPAGQTDHEPLAPKDASKVFNVWCGKVSNVIQLISSSGRLSAQESIREAPARYRPNTAFIIMSMKPELVDVVDAIKQVFESFGVRAVRADEIEHQEIITDRILEELKTAEFLFADLTDERPNVYYEVGYAHALGRRVILFRKVGTGLHFDLAGYNCPEYENLRDLRTKMEKRLMALTNRQPKKSLA